MKVSYQDEHLESLVKDLCHLTTEIECVEFKLNNAKPDEIGEYISALSNTAAITGQPYSYLIWGVDDESHEIVGTTFTPAREKCGNEDLINWLSCLLAPKIRFQFLTVNIDTKEVVVLEISAATHTPVSFRGTEYIRIGSYKKKLKDHPEMERALWAAFEKRRFEQEIAAEKLSADQVLEYIFYPAYFDLLKKNLPGSKNAILKELNSEEIIQPDSHGKWNVTNMGAILFAKDITKFKRLRRKAVRVVFYKGSSRIETEREVEFTGGYAFSYEEIVSYVTELSPKKEIIEKGIRKSISLFPELAVRELIANALIHQDFYISGTSPMIEIFSDRIEITNPGLPLIAVERFLDTPPKSRNEHIASLLRRIGVCEERGSGIDKVVAMTEFYQLPAPIFETMPEYTRVVLFAHRCFKEIDKSERIRATYLHASLKYVERKSMTNKTLRERFELDVKNSATISRIIRDTIEIGLIKCQDDTVGTKAKKYLPYWA